MTDQQIAKIDLGHEAMSIRVEPHDKADEATNYDYTTPPIVHLDVEVIRDDLGIQFTIELTERTLVALLDGLEQALELGRLTAEIVKRAEARGAALLREQGRGGTNA